MLWLINVPSSHATVARPSDRGDRHAANVNTTAFTRASVLSKAVTHGHKSGDIKDTYP